MPVRDLFDPGRNCHRLATSRRAAFIIDGEAYFRALHESFRRARRNIFIIGWDLHSELQLVRDDEKRCNWEKLGALLDRLVSERKALRVCLLSWDFAMIYAMEREFFPRYKLKWRTHDRISFRLDGDHPVGASQHQKIVVVDDAVAFAGGLDISQWRWDTPDHRPDDPRRIDPGGKPYPPFHDVQMIVDGPAARVLGELARERWKRAGGQKSPPIGRADADDPWPQSITPDIGPVQVAVARTLPAYKDQEPVREVEALYLDSIAAAERFIYIENQYLSSHGIGQALKRRLMEEDGPEIVVVMPQETGGWLEQHTMDVFRGRILKKLSAADRHDRLRIYYPRIAEEPHCPLMVHAKVMVIDEAFVRIGSSNLSNRSMGLDSECDLAIAAGSDDKIRQAIADFRNRLLSEHLAVDRADISNALYKSGSLIKTIESMRQGPRTLAPLSAEIPDEIDEWIPESALLDPEKPVAPEELIDFFVSPGQQPFAYRHLLKVILLIAGILLLAALWRWSPLGQWMDVASMLSAGEWIRQQPLTPLLVPAAYIIGGIISFPVTLMIIGTVIVFGPWWGLVYALIGSQLSALVVFGTGRILGREPVRRFCGSLLNRLSQKLADSGLMAVITFRIVPVAPFSVINLIAGVSEIRFRDFAMGTFLGMLPSVLVMVFLADRISVSLRRPDLESFTALSVAVVMAGAGLMGLRRYVRKKRANGSQRESK